MIYGSGCMVRMHSESRILDNHYYSGFDKKNLYNHFIFVGTYYVTAMDSLIDKAIFTWSLSLVTSLSLC